ncbi:MAG: phytanoyl-CoA dioxygenase family protein [Acidobacteriaceae bacterium]|nr:phytanoyl-CoA dioxygenase family protein [Acidobacteriaceae bacterium]MBV8570285.1 phytanoyl-CoA dioxygenase family protein [Acidobacteriaceae bacterium]
MGNGKALDRDQLGAYHQQGFLFPLPAFSESEAAAFRASLEQLEQEHSGRLPARVNRKPHLLLTWLNELIRDPRILDPVEDIIGPNILCWGSGFFIKNPHEPARVTWHQDSTYWGLSKPDVVTAWIAFSPSTTENGCMRVIPGTHTLAQLPHCDTFSPENLLSRGQEIAVEVDESKALDVVLRPGQMSLHHVMLVHGSEPNHSNVRRVGFAIRYLPTYIKQVADVRDSATLVRGTDGYRHFVLEPAPRSDFHPDAVAFHSEMLASNDQILYGKNTNSQDSL